MTFLCIFSCRNKLQTNIDENKVLDSIHSDGNILREALENEDSIFEQVENSISQYIDQNGTFSSEDAIENYYMIDSILHNLYDYNEPIENQWQLYTNLTIKVHQIKFLNYYLLNQISSKADNKFSNLLYEEKVLTDSLEWAIHNFLESHIDNAAVYDDQHYLIKYYNISLNIYLNRNETLKELLFSMNDDDHYTPKYHKLPISLFDKEYKHIQNDLIPHKSSSTRYNEASDRQAIITIKQVWSDFIAKRNEISQLLPPRHRKVWDNATYRFQRSHLIVLKNEFEGLWLPGLPQEAAQEVILQDTCTYEELLAYPNFTIKWNEYLRQKNKRIGS